jgi:hypothetical protein
MIIHTKVAASRRKKKKSRGPIAKKLDVEKLYRDSSRGNYNPPPRVLRPGSEDASKIKSHVTTKQFVPAIKSMMNPVTLAQESEETRNEIIAKSKRIAIAYSKGAYQYITDDADAKTIGRKNPI